MGQALQVEFAIVNEWDVQTWMGAIALILLSIQAPATALLMARLLRGPGRIQPLKPAEATPDQKGAVSIVIPTLNEAERIAPCLAGVTRQGYEVREIIVVDSQSTDGTVEQVKAAQASDPRFRLIYDDPLPQDWVGRPWALHNGFLHSSPESEWILGIDADTVPRPGLVASLVALAQQQQYDVVSLSPQFILKTAGEFWLQPALLMTLVYRFGPSGSASESAERVMANGQCFLIRRSLLEELGGYTIAKDSFCDDVTLARQAAAQGAIVQFLDGAKVLQVRMYEGLQDTWDGWGRSLDLKDASSVGQKWGDLALLAAVQGAPVILTPLLTALVLLSPSVPLFLTAALGLNGGLLLIRFALLFAIRPSYAMDLAQGADWSFWLSPLADPLAVYRIFLSSTRRPTQWRSRDYSNRL
ncbi:MAG: 2'-O-glycosyltransferase CruG [Elainellaceae cyanobacterium]